jgi:hypothetical protein
MRPEYVSLKIVTLMCGYAARDVPLRVRRTPRPSITRDGRLTALPARYAPASHTVGTAPAWD